MACQQQGNDGTQGWTLLVEMGCQPRRTGWGSQFWAIALFLILSIGVCWGVLGYAFPVHAAESVKLDQRSLRGQDFSSQDLTNASFVRSDLSQSDFSHSNLQGARLFSAKLGQANLEGADLRGSTLDLADLTKANLTNANLEGAFAFSARFNRATITGADFTDVLLREDARDLLCAIAQGTNPVTGRDTRETLLCD